MTCAMTSLGFAGQVPNGSKEIEKTLRTALREGTRAAKTRSKLKPLIPHLRTDLSPC